MRVKFKKRALLSFAVLFLGASLLFASFDSCPFVFYISLDQRTLNIEEKESTNKALDLSITAYQTKIQQANARARAALDNNASDLQIPLKHMSFNTGLLNRLFGLAYVPEYATRARAIPALLDVYLRQQKPTFVTLQEVWNLADGEYLARIARANGYVSFLASQSGKSNPFGLQTFIRKDSLQNETSTEAHEVIPMPQQMVERVAGLQKGIFPVIATLKSGHRILIVNAHFAYAPQKTTSRLYQAQMLSNYIQERANKFDYVIIGADTNSSDRFDAQFDTVENGWFKDKSVYLALMEANAGLNLRDSFAANTTSTDGFTQDPARNDLTRYSSTTKTEPAQRLDYIFVGSKRHSPTNYVIDKARLVFDEPLRKLDGSPVLSQEHAKEKARIFPSDHFGIETTLRIAK